MNNIIRICIATFYFFTGIFIANANNILNKSETVYLINPYSPGSASDRTLRYLKDKIDKKYPEKYNILIESKVGVGGDLAAQYVATYTGKETYILLNGNSFIFYNYNNDNPRYDYKNINPIAYLGYYPTILVVNSKKLPNVKNWEDFKNIANSDNLNYGSSGIGSGAHLQTEYLNYILDKKFKHIPYKGAAAALPDLLSGEIDFMFMFPNQTYQHQILQPLVSFSEKRIVEYPNVPSYKELKIPNDTYIKTWIGLFSNKYANPSVIKDIKDILNEIYSTESGRKEIEHYSDLHVEKSNITKDFSILINLEMSQYKKISEKIIAFRPIFK